MMQTKRVSHCDAIIIGAGAAGLMCGWQAVQRGLKVCILEHTNRVAEKIRISGGGKCNFTNLYSSPDNFISQNAHFCKSAFARFDQHDFIALVEEHKIKYHEKAYEEKTGNENARGQLFCDNSAADIIDMLRYGFENLGGILSWGVKVSSTKKENGVFHIETNNGDYIAPKLVIASGGLSIPKIGASNFGYELAKQYGLNVIPPRAGLVPLTFAPDLLEKTKPLSGVSVDAKVTAKDGTSFREGLLFTHRGLSGPSILQISSYWKQGEEIFINLCPEINIFEHLKERQEKSPKQMLRTVLSEIIPARILTLTADLIDMDTRIADIGNKKLQAVSERLSNWAVKPNGSEGYRTAEVTLGGVDTTQISSKTFEANTEKGLYFIGEVLDVTGHLGGHNFQWAWSSAWCCAQHL